MRSRPGLAERAKFFARVAANLFERYTARARVPDALSVTPEAERALLAACGHAARLGRDQLFEWIVEAQRPFHVAARWRVLEEVYANALVRFPEPASGRAWLLDDLAYVRHAVGRHAEAEAPFDQAVGIIKTALGEAYVHYATTLHDLARVR